MTPTPCQRWTERRARYRPAGERIDPARHTVAEIDHAPARSFVERHHYSGTWPSVSRAWGLYLDRGPVWAPDLVGVCALGVPAGPHVLARYAGATPALELSRLVLRDEVPGNGESWFVARVFRAAGLGAVVSYSDPLPRETTDGRLVTPGHVGVVYQALGAQYLGRTRPRWIYLDAQGRALSERALSKVRAQHRGCVAAEKDLIARGAPPRRPGEEPGVWVDRALLSFRRVLHPGQHVYRWAWSEVPALPTLPYPRRPVDAVESGRRDSTHLPRPELVSA